MLERYAELVLQLLVVVVAEGCDLEECRRPEIRAAARRTFVVVADIDCWHLFGAGVVVPDVEIVARLSEG